VFATVLGQKDADRMTAAHIHELCRSCGGESDVTLLQAQRILLSIREQDVTAATITAGPPYLREDDDDNDRAALVMNVAPTAAEDAAKAADAVADIVAGAAAVSMVKAQCRPASTRHKDESSASLLQKNRRIRLPKRHQQATLSEDDFLSLVLQQQQVQEQQLQHEE
jgi:hypothetical protein